MEDVQLPQMQEMMNAMNIRLSTAEAQNQTLTQVLNNTQTELVHVKAQVAAAPSVSSGLTKGVKTQAPARFGGRPTVSYPTTQAQPAPSQVDENTTKLPL